MSVTTTPVVTALAVPVVAGFSFTVGAKVAKIDLLMFPPSGKSWTMMMDQIRESGDRTDKATPRGFNHPCQTDDLRCDHQGLIMKDYVNTQVQLGGRTKSVTRGDPSKESTTVSQVNVNVACYSTKGMFNDALAKAHDYSWKTKNVVQLETNSPAVFRVAPVGVLNFKCNQCGKLYNAVDSIELGLRLGGFPPRCNCGGTPVRY